MDVDDARPPSVDPRSPREWGGAEEGAGQAKSALPAARQHQRPSPEAAATGQWTSTMPGRHRWTPQSAG
eukprot:15111391-Alexandrium_andersonii.AAC.1